MKGSRERNSGFLSPHSQIFWVVVFWCRFDIFATTLCRFRKEKKDVREFGWYHPYRLGVFKELENATEQGAAGHYKNMMTSCHVDSGRTVDGEHQTGY